MENIVIILVVLACILGVGWLLAFILQFVPIVIEYVVEVLKDTASAAAEGAGALVIEALRLIGLVLRLVVRLILLPFVIGYVLLRGRLQLGLTRLIAWQSAQGAGKGLTWRQIVRAFVMRESPPAPDLAEALTGDERSRSVLGLPDTFTKEDVEDHYLRLIRAVHPDAGGSALLAQQVNAARAYLYHKHGWKRRPK